jgi:hypothetical protein
MTFSASFRGSGAFRHVNMERSSDLTSPNGCGVVGQGYQERGAL